MADIVQGHRITLDGEQNAEDAWTAAIGHLPEGNAERLGFVIGGGIAARAWCAALRWPFLGPRTSG